MSQHTQQRKIADTLYTPAMAWGIFIVSVILTGITFVVTSNLARQDVQNRFEFSAKEIVFAINERLRIYEEVLWGGVALFNASKSVERDEWHQYVKTVDINKHWPGIQGMGFVPSVKADELQGLVEQIRGEGFADFKIHPAGEREYYTPVVYLEPFDWRNQRAFGFDMWSSPVHREAMIRARDIGKTALSGPVKLVLETDDDVQKGFLVYLPVYKKNVPLTTPEERKAGFEGWIYAPFRVKDLMRGTLGQYDSNIDFEIYDGTDIRKDALLYVSGEARHVDDGERRPPFKKTIDFSFAGRPWTIYFYATGDFIQEADKRQPKIIGLIGLIIDLLIFYVIYSLYSVHNRAKRLASQMTKELNDRAEELEKAKSSLEEKVQERTHALEDARNELEIKVEERTGELVEKNQALEKTKFAMMNLLEDLNASKKSIERQKQDLEKANEELDAFVYTASHDLSAPLRGVSSFASILEEDYKDKLDEQGKDYLNEIRKGAQRMSRLIEDLLTLSRISRIQNPFMETNIKEVLDGVFERLKHDIQVSKAKIDVPTRLPTIFCDKIKMTELFANLISNAVKFSSRHPSDRPQVKVTYQELEGAHQFSVKDNGIGIDPQYHDQIFEMFKRLHTQLEFEGTGAGLNIVRRVVEEHGGRVWIVSEEGKGAEFFFTIAKDIKGRGQAEEALSEDEVVASKEGLDQTLKGQEEDL